MPESTARVPDPKVDALIDRLDRTLKLSAAEVARRLAHDYAGALLRLRISAEVAPEPGDIILNVGITGTGKSTWAKHQLARWKSSRVLVWDYCDEYSVFGRQTEFVMLGPITRRMTIDELIDDPDVLYEPDLRLVVVPTARGAKGRGADFRDFVALLELDDEERADEETENRGLLPYVLVLDEVARYAHYASDEFEAIATIGRHSGVSVLACSQWAAAIPHPLRRQSSRIVAHGQSWDIDIDALAQPMGRELAERVRKLPKHERVIWDRAASSGANDAA